VGSLRCERSTSPHSSNSRTISVISQSSSPCIGLPPGAWSSSSSAARRPSHLKARTSPSSSGHGLVDRELYLPRSWTGDPDRCRAAGIPDQVGFATKPVLARAMLARALDAGVRAAWVAGDEVYGADPRLRAWLEASGVGYVLAVACDHRVPFGGDTCRAATPCLGVSRRGHGSRCPAARAPRATAATTGRSSASTTTASPPLARWQASTGSWSAATSAPASWPSTAAGCPARCRWPPWSGSPDNAGGSRSALQTGKGLVGLDQHQVRRWRSWYRWVTLAMLAHAFLLVAAVTDQARDPAPPGLVKLTCNQVQHLFAALVARPVGDAGHRLRWSLWRRRCQARARTCHYRRRATQPCVAAVSVDCRGCWQPGSASPGDVDGTGWPGSGLRSCRRRRWWRCPRLAPRRPRR
jgi:DDE superfamily endonuclease